MGIVKGIFGIISAPIRIGAAIVDDTFSMIEGEPDKQVAKEISKTVENFNNDSVSNY